MVGTYSLHVYNSKVHWLYRGEQKLYIGDIQTNILGALLVCIVSSTSKVCNKEDGRWNIDNTILWKCPVVPPPTLPASPLPPPPSPPLPPTSQLPPMALLVAHPDLPLAVLIFPSYPNPHHISNGHIMVLEEDDGGIWKIVNRYSLTHFESTIFEMEYTTRSQCW